MAATDIPKTKNINMYYIPENIIKENNLPEWFKGCNTIGDYHPLHKKHNVEKFVKVESVELISVSRLFYSNNVRGLEYMKIDTEGHDCIILKGLYEYLRYLPDNFHPREIKFESNEHTNPENIDKIISLYESFDYYLVSRDYDTVLKKVKNVKLLCNWTDSESVCAQWNRYNTEKGIRFTSKNPDYYVIINHPINNEYYEADKTIVFQMEPWVYDESKNWGIKTWGEWARPDESKFLRVYKEKNLFVNSFNGENIKQNKINRIVSICSSKNQDTGHILRNNFIRRLEAEINMIDVFGRDNYHNFSSYVGQLEDDKTFNGYSKYKYAFTAENNAEDNYATEKIYEPIMCECLCFYWGCPNLEEFLNPMAFVRLDLNDVEGSLATVKKAIEEDWWSKRIDVIRKEKERIMKELNFFKKMEDIIESCE